MLGVTFVLANATPGSYANNAGNVSHVNVCVYLTGQTMHNAVYCTAMGMEEVVLIPDNTAQYYASSACMSEPVENRNILEVKIF